MPPKKKDAIALPSEPNPEDVVRSASPFKYVGLNMHAISGKWKPMLLMLHATSATCMWAYLSVNVATMLFSFVSIPCPHTAASRHKRAHRAPFSGFMVSRGHYLAAGSRDQSWASQVHTEAQESGMPLIAACIWWRCFSVLAMKNE